MQTCVCGEEFLPAYPSQEHCSRECRKQDTKKPAKSYGRPAGFLDPQTRCRVGTCTEKGVHQHHVVLRQHVEANGGDIGDARNALAMCELHHGRHHKARRRIKVSELRPENIEYIREMYGGAAEDYMGRYFDVTP